MRVALIPLRILPCNLTENRCEVKALLAQIALRCPDLVCLPGCALTDTIYRQVDLERFAEPVPGDSTEWLGNLARKFSLIHRLARAAASGLLYSSALLFNRRAPILLHYRKPRKENPFLRGNTFATRSYSLWASGDSFLGRRILRTSLANGSWLCQRASCAVGARLRRSFARRRRVGNAESVRLLLTLCEKNDSQPSWSTLWESKNTNLPSAAR